MIYFQIRTSVLLTRCGHLPEPCTGHTGEKGDQKEPSLAKRRRVLGVGSLLGLVFDLVYPHRHHLGLQAAQICDFSTLPDKETNVLSQHCLCGAREQCHLRVGLREPGVV